MKKIVFVLVAIAAFASCKKNDFETCEYVVHPKADSLQKMLLKYTSLGVPGAVIALKDAHGSWSGAAGFADLSNKTPMKAGMLQYGFSITKLVTAVSVMQLKENGLIDINRPVRDYLPPTLHAMVPKTGEVTVRMLLNHTTGYNDYVRTPEFQQLWLSNPLKVWTRAEYYSFIKQHTTLLFNPGKDYKYSNTNYYLLSIIIDQVTGRPHGEWFQEKIFDKLALKQTFYKSSKGYPFYSNLPEVYWPRLEDGAIENITGAQRAWMQSEEFGATGLIAAPADYIRLLQGLVNTELVSAASLHEMKQWVQGSGSSEPDYGLGLSFWGFKGKPAYGHDGDGIGATIELIYFEKSKTFVLAAANASTEFGGEMATLLHGFRNEVGEYLAGF